MDEQIPEQHHSSSKFWLIAVLVLVTVVVGYVQWRISRAPSDDQEALRPAAPYVAPVVAPPIEKLEDVKQYTAGRPVPEVSTQESMGNYLRNDHIRGNPSARFTILEYANLTSNYARLMQPELAEFVAENEDVNWVFRHYPIARRELDYPAAYMSECVFRTGWHEAFWDYIDAVYYEGPEDEDALFRLAVDITGDEKRFSHCYESGISEKDVKDHKRLGYMVGNVRVTPTFFFVDNLTKQERVMPGIDSMDFVKKVIDEMRKVEA
jgi:protein-disulfide isomerase